MEELNEQTSEQIFTERDRLYAIVESRILRESLSLFSDYIDPRDAARDSYGNLWNVVGTTGGQWGGGGSMKGQPGTDRAGFRDQMELDRARECCRILAEISEFAINILENRISYVVGTGHTYTVAAKPGKDVDKKTIVIAQDWLEEWMYEVDWPSRQQETRRRLDRDGEAFLRFFPQENGVTELRFVEPWQVTAPTSDVCAAFGIKTAEQDVERIEAYYIDEKEVDASEVQHRKANVDRNVRRGMPTLWPIKDLLRRADKILTNLTAKIEIQSAISLIRQHAAGTTPAAASTFRASKAVDSRTNPLTQQPEYLGRYRPGTIIDAPAGLNYSFPPAVAGMVADAVAGLQSILRAVASRVVMPEFMLTSDASNANYASTMVAEGPAIKMFERLQHETKHADLKVLYRAMEHAEAIGLLPGDLSRAIEIQVGLPQIITRNKLAEVQESQALVSMGVLSPQTAAANFGLDYEQEQQNIAEHQQQQGGGLGGAVDILGSMDAA